MRLLWNPQTLSFTFEIPEMPQTDGVQKILGFSRGYHHWNSVRLGIRKENDYCVLYSYIYRNGKRIINRMGTAKVGDNLKCVLSWNNTIYVRAGWNFDVEGKPKFSNPIGYLLMPYQEKDGKENKVIPFKVRIWDIQVNNKPIKL